VNQPPDGARLRPSESISCRLNIGRQSATGAGQSADFALLLCDGRGVSFTGGDREVTPHTVEVFVASVCSAFGHNQSKVTLPIRLHLRAFVEIEMLESQGNSYQAKFSFEKPQNKEISMLNRLQPLIALVLLACSISTSAEDQSLHEQRMHSRAVEAVVWAMPLMNYKFYRDALIEAGVGPNDIGYFSKVQDWRFQTATPNNTTPYIMTHWTLKDGPVVVEIPPATKEVGIFGTIMDAWQRPLDDVGAAGRDRGRGATYLLVPPGYNGPLLAGALVYEQRTLNGFAVLRPIIGDASPENLAKAAEYVRQIRIYRLGEESVTKYVDLYGKLLEMTPVLDETVYSEIYEIINEEPIEEMNLAMMGMLRRIGVVKGQPFEPNEKMKAVYAKAAPEALEYMIDQYHRRLMPWFYEGKKWSPLVPSGAIETDWSYEYPSHFDYSARGALYYAIITSVKNYGSASFYLDLAESPDGEWLDGGKSYKLVMPPNVPVRDFWAITTYDLESASYLRDIEPSSIDSTMPSVKRNDDGSIDIYFGPNPPLGMESNWLPTDPERRFFLLARFYGPEPEIVNGSFELNDIEMLE